MTSWTKWLWAPLHAFGVATQAKSFRDNVVIGSPWLNRHGLHVWRRRAAARMGQRRRAALAGLVSAEDAAAFARDGYLIKPDFLAPEVFAALQAEVSALEVPAREFVDGYTFTRLIPLDSVSLPAMQATRAVVASAAYQNLHAYVGSFRRFPRLSIQTIFSRFREDVPDVQSHYHSDTFHPTVKSWLYLTEVDAAAAAFTYVPGSHVANRRRMAWERRVSLTAREGSDRLTAEGSMRISEAELHRLGYPAPRKLAVAPNTLVIADTSGFHRRGISQSQACRISIWAYSRSNPFLPFVGSVLPDVPALRGRLSRAVWAVLEAARRGKPARGWHWAGVRRADTPP
ncbi:phytanoyl-CoA dioxygenase family protein [Humitalea sp. 24SJ18S-53]|uniref:phytanoyl-CoA dioxygenase family protein n=1 Tax=Humitalea sp. 24SJ18S-53 TaxID=3422307 RepID=UPI003D66FB87